MVEGKGTKVTRPITPSEIKERCARAICAPCAQNVERAFEVVSTGDIPDKDTFAWVHISRDYKRACVADGIYKIPDEELS